MTRAPCTLHTLFQLCYGGNFFIINLLYGSEWRHGAATCHNSGELPTRPAGREAGRQTARESRRYKTAAARHGAVRRVAGGARAGSRQQSADPSSGQAVRAISLLTIVIATLPTFSHPTQRQFVCTSAVHSGPKVRKLREINHDCWIDGNQSASPVEYVCQLNHCAAAETRTEACRECLVQVAWGLGHVTGSYLTSPGTHRWPQSPEWFC